MEYLMQGVINWLCGVIGVAGGFMVGAALLLTKHGRTHWEGVRNGLLTPPVWVGLFAIVRFFQGSPGAIIADALMSLAGLVLGAFIALCVKLLGGGADHAGK